MKRSFASFGPSSSVKRAKSNSNITDNGDVEITKKSLKFFVEPSKNLFINRLRMPPILFKHQLYSLNPDKMTLIDRQLQEMLDSHNIRFFHSDLGIMIMMTQDYQLLIERQLTEMNFSSSAIEKSRIKQRFLNEFLMKWTRLHVDREQLESQYKFDETEIQLLIQVGLLVMKDTDQYWISIPNISLFVTCVKKAREVILRILSRRTYRELPINEFRQRDTKKSCPLGFDYHIYEIIGANLAHLIDTPTGLVVKIGPEKH